MAILGRTLKSSLLKVSHAEDVYIFTEEGKKYLDVTSGAMVANLGYSNNDILQIAFNASEKIHYFHNSRAITKETELLADLIVKNSPSKDYLVYFTVSGSDAIEAAIRLSRCYQQGKGNSHKYSIAAATHSYHGSTMGALSATGVKYIKETYTRMLPSFAHLPSAFCYHCPLEKEYPTCNLACSNEVEKFFNSQEGKSVAAFIIEPVVANAAGTVSFPENYLNNIKQSCEDNDVVLIADEIATGLGRTGKMFACEHYGLIPDVICIGKGLSVGYYPISAMLVHKRIVEKIGPNSNLLGHTYNGNPVGVNISLYVLEKILKENWIENVRKKGLYLLERLKRFEKYSIVGDVRGKGLLASLEFVENKSIRKSFPNHLDVSDKIYQIALGEGLLLLPGKGCVDGLSGDHITLAPPFIINETQIDFIIEKLERSINRFYKEFLNVKSSMV